MLDKAIRIMITMAFALLITILYTYKNNEIKDLKNKNELLVQQIESLKKTYNDNMKLKDLNENIKNHIFNNKMDSQNIIQDFKRIDGYYSNYTGSK